MHQDLILNALRTVCGKARAVCAVKGINRLNESDRADGDQIVLIFICEIVFAHDVGDQPQIVLDQLGARRVVAFLHLYK